MDLCECCLLPEPAAAAAAGLLRAAGSRAVQACIVLRAPCFRNAFTPLPRPAPHPLPPHPQTAYYSSSLRALFDLGKRLGYTLVGTDQNGVNGFFVRSDILACQRVKASARAASPLLEESCGWQAGLSSSKEHTVQKNLKKAACRQTGLLASHRRSQISHPHGLLQPLPFEELYSPMLRYGWHAAETNQSRKWLFLDEQGNVVRREFKPI